MGIKILTADDSKVMRFMLYNTLTGAGHEVIQACDGKEGAELASQTKFDMIISDVNMPGVNGLEFAKIVRQNPDYSSTPIIFITTELHEDFQEKAKELSAAAWITKPFSPIDLLKVVEKQLKPAKKILIVDDSKVMRCMLHNTLSCAGHAVTQACDGKEGADLAAQDKFDLIITDVNMPKMTGVDLTRHLRQTELHKYAPIVFLTSEIANDFKAAAKEVGATAWITKPFTPHDLLKIVAKIIP